MANLDAYYLRRFGFLYWLRKDLRHELLVVSLWTVPLGLTEPLFVPEYWNPPSLFDLANTIGFDIESILFSFAIGGIGFVIYRFIFPFKLISVPDKERTKSLHLCHKRGLPCLTELFAKPILQKVSAYFYLILFLNYLRNNALQMLLHSCVLSSEQKIIDSTSQTLCFYLSIFLFMTIKYSKNKN